MKEIRPKEDKAVSPIIATILLIAITVVLAATLVTILGGFTHGAGNTVEAAGVTTALSTNGSAVTATVSSSSQALTNNQITFTLTVNGSIVFTGLLSTAHGNSTVSSTHHYLDISSTSSSLTGGTTYTFMYKSGKNAVANNSISTYELSLNYKGTQFYSSGLQTS